MSISFCLSSVFWAFSSRMFPEGSTGKKKQSVYFRNINGRGLWGFHITDLPDSRCDRRRQEKGWSRAETWREKKTPVHRLMTWCETRWRCDKIVEITVDQNECEKKKKKHSFWSTVVSNTCMCLTLWSTRKTDVLYSGLYNIGMHVCVCHVSVCVTCVREHTWVHPFPVVSCSWAGGCNDSGVILWWSRGSSPGPCTWWKYNKWSHPVRHHSELRNYHTKPQREITPVFKSLY